jgi:hypothetical protein
MTLLILIVISLLLVALLVHYFKIDKAYRLLINLHLLKYYIQIKKIEYKGRNLLRIDII